MAKSPAPARPSLKMVAFPPGVIKDAVAAASGKRRDMFDIPIGDIQVFKGFNIRIADTDNYKEDIERLKQSIMQHGFYNTKPLACVASLDASGNDVIYVIDGHRRLEAARQAVAEGAELEALPVIMKPVDTDMLDLATSLDIENTQRALKPLERGVLVQRLRKAGLTQEAVGERLGITGRYVADLELLMGAPKEVRQLVADEKVQAYLAVKKLRANAENAVEELTAMVERAESRGQARATQADEGEGRPPVKMTREVIKYVGKAGTDVMLEDIERFQPFFGDDEWFTKVGRSTKKVRLTEDIEVTVTVRRPARDVAADEPEEGEEATEETAAAEEQPRPRRGRRKTAAAPQAGLDLGDAVADAGGDAPDLEAAGVADRIEDL